MQISAIAHRLVVRRARRRPLACDAANGLRSPDEAGVVAICTITRVGGVQIRDPSLSFEF